MRRLPIALLALACACSWADPSGLSWTPPTEREDGSPLAPGDITGYRLVCGEHSVALPPGSSAGWPAGWPGPGEWTCALRAVAGPESGPSLPFAVSIDAVTGLLAPGHVVVRWRWRETARSRDVTFPGVTWETRTAAQAGMSQANIDALAAALPTRGFLVRDGYKIAEWGTGSVEWASAAKPVTATMLLFAIKESLLSGVDDLVEAEGWTGQFITKDEPMTFAHLANMTGGYMRAEAPGAAWAYNDRAVMLLHKTLFDNVFGETPDTAAHNSARLGPLQFESATLYGGAGAPSIYRIWTSVGDMARIGWFWLNKGFWDGVQLLPEAYFDAYMQPLVAGSLPRTSGTNPNGDYLGVGTYGGGTDQSAVGPGVYGFGWWFNAEVGQTTNLLFPRAPADLFMAQGHFGDETLVVIPSLGLVFASKAAAWGNLLTDAGVADSTMDQMMALLASTVLPEIANVPDMTVGQQASITGSGFGN